MNLTKFTTSTLILISLFACSEVERRVEVVPIYQSCMTYLEEYHQKLIDVGRGVEFDFLIITSDNEADPNLKGVLKITYDAKEPSHTAVLNSVDMLCSPAFDFIEYSSSDQGTRNMLHRFKQNSEGGTETYLRFREEGYMLYFNRTTDEQKARIASE